VPATGGHVPTLEIIWVCLNHPEFFLLGNSFGKELPTLDFVQKENRIITAHSSGRALKRHTKQYKKACT